MPGYKGHLLGAAAADTVYMGALKAAPLKIVDTSSGLLSDWQLMLGLFVVALLFGLWPDVDTNSKGQNIFFGIAFVSDVLLIATGRLEAAAFLGLLAMTPIIGKHRGWTHSKWAMFVVPAPILILPYIYKPELLGYGILFYGAAWVGYFSHLLLDGKITRYVHVRGSRHEYYA